MRNFDEMEIALLKNEFRNMYYDIGFIESLVVLNEILQSASILAEVLIDEKRKEEGHSLDPS